MVNTQNQQPPRASSGPSRPQQRPEEHSPDMPEKSHRGERTPEDIPKASAPQRSNRADGSAVRGDDQPPSNRKEKREEALKEEYLREKVGSYEAWKRKRNKKAKEDRYVSSNDDWEPRKSRGDRSSTKKSEYARSSDLEVEKGRPTKKPRDRNPDKRKNMNNQERFIEEELDRVLRVGDNDELLTPFTTRIIKAKLPKSFKNPSFQAFDGTGDPEDFLYAFKFAMSNRTE